MTLLEKRIEKGDCPKKIQVITEITLQIIFKMKKSQWIKICVACIANYSIKRKSHHFCGTICM